MLKWGLIFLSISLSTSVWAAKSQEQLLQEFNKAYIDIYRELIDKNLLERLEIQNSKINEFSENPFAQDVLRQLIATDQSVAGLHFDSINNYAHKGKAVDNISLDLNLASPLDAVKQLTIKAKTEQIVMINEAHHIAQHRVLTRQLLEGLWRNGYRYFAVEALAEGGEDYIHEGYTTTNSGKYIEEPIYSSLLIAAKRIGFKIISYDYGDQSSRKSRELDAADNLITKVFSKDKNAKVLIHCGYSHIKEQDGWLADILKKKTGIDPLTVNQTDIIEQMAVEDELLIYREILDATDADKPLILNTSEGLWSAKPTDYDVNIIWPRTKLVNNRPGWASMNRKALKITPKYCNGHLPCLIEVYHNDLENIHPSDRMMLTNTHQEAVIFLEPTSKILKATSLSGSKSLPLEHELH